MKRDAWRICLVSYVIGNWPIRQQCLWALNQEAEGLNLMLWWRTFLAPLNWVKEEEVNILGYVDLYEHWGADVEFSQDTLDPTNIIDNKK